MSKKIILYCCALSLLFTFSHTVLAQQVNVTLSAPANLSAGSEFVVEATISKPNISGFAKFQVELPDGFISKQDESKGGSFTFVDQKMKIIWMSLPTDNEFKISYKIIPPASFSGSFELAGTFSYVDNNETQKFKIAPSSIMIGSGGGSAPAPIQEKPKEPEVQKSAPVQETKPVIEKPVVIPPTPAPVKQPEVVQEKTPEPEISIEESNEEPQVVSVISIKGKSASSKNEKTNAAPAQTEVAESKRAVTPAAPSSSGIQYRVQLAATHNASDADSLKQKTGISAIYSEPVSGGVHRFTAGNFSEYVQARDLRNSLREKGLQGAFIVAYKNGSLINLQEALKLTGQKWVP